jgi:two-component system, response regulator FlrC
MPEAMLEALLFGHQKGAFTGATEASEGFFRAADGGTLLLDEIAEMPLALQAKLLRALQEGEVVPIGSTQPIKIDVRVIACANRDLPTEVAEGRFRADLSIASTFSPWRCAPLRERPDDIAPLAFAMALRHTPRRVARCLDFRRGAGDAEAARLARQCPRAGERHPPRAAAGRWRAPEIDQPAPTSFRPARPAGAPKPAGPARTGGKRLSNIVQLSEGRAIMETLDACNGSRIAAPASSAFPNGPCAIAWPPSVKPGSKLTRPWPGGRR